VHLSGKDTDEALLKHYGIFAEEFLAEAHDALHAKNFK